MTYINTTVNKYKSILIIRSSVKLYRERYKGGGANEGQMDVRNNLYYHNNSNNSFLFLNYIFFFQIHNFGLLVNLNTLIWWFFFLIFRGIIS